jgi:hypothetical protein
MRKKHFEAMGFPYALDSPKELLGINTIMSMIKETGKMLGLNACGHAFHHLFISPLVNEPGVNVEESLATYHHNSVAAQHAYMTRGSTSEWLSLMNWCYMASKLPLMVCLGFGDWGFRFGVSNLGRGIRVWACFKLWGKLTIN